MPNRIIKESICVSEQIDQLTPFEETFFYRLLVNCDDYGNMDGREKILAARLFPLKEISIEQVKNAVQKLSSIGLIELYAIGGKTFINVPKWNAHQRVRDSKRKYPPKDAESCGELPQANAESCGELPQDAADSGLNPNPNPNPNTNPNPNPNPIAEGFMDDDAARLIQDEQNRVLDAAEDAGFLKSNTVRARLLNLYAEHGLERVLQAIGSCVKHSAPNLAYLEACLKGEPKKPKRKQTVVAQDFEQRDYTDVQRQLEEETAKQVIQMLKDNGEWDYENNCKKGVG